MSVAPATTNTNQAQSAPVGKPSANNVQYNEILLLPANIKDARPVEVTWYQDTYWTDSARRAVYVAAHGYNKTHVVKEVLVFIATECVADAYETLIPQIHLNKIKEPDSDQNVVKVKMTPRWQWGTFGGDNDRFVVLHHSDRKPYAKRFMSAINSAPGSLNALLTDAKANVNSNSNGTFYGGASFPVAMGLSVAQTVLNPVMNNLDKGSKIPGNTALTPFAPGK